MGNLFSRRRLKHLKDETLRLNLDDILKNDREFKACQEHVKFIQSGAVKDTNNLELYLNDVYEKECVFKAELEEVEFIQKEIETLVQKIVDLVLEGFISKNKGFEDYLKVTSNTHFSRGETLENFLTELYFPIKTGDRYVKVRSTRCPILKVGSFYEGTKNTFPDEFDFIFLLYSAAPPNLESYIERKDGHNASLFWAHRCIKETLTACNKESLKCVPPHGGLHRDRELYFDRYVKKHGPASMLRFIYNNGSMGQRYINVDLVPACKVYTGKDLAKYEFPSYLTNQVKPKSFREDFWPATHYLGVETGVSFTELELRFMKNVLSLKHVKVYRILKFLINGHGDGETLQTYRRTFHLGSLAITGYSSYQIKIMMIHHHDECTNTDTEHLGPCVIQVLNEMCQHENNGSFPKLYDFNLRDPSEMFCLLPFLHFLTRKLGSWQIADDSYDYEKARMKSVTRQYLDILDRAVPDMAEYLASLDDVNPHYETWLQYLELSFSKTNECLKYCTCCVRSNN